MLRTKLALVLLAGLLVGIAPTSWGQEGPTPAARPRPGSEERAEKIDAATAARLLTETYEETKDSTSAEDFGRAIEVCERAIAAEPPEKIVRYAHQLAAWAYNRRGEVFADQAASLFNQGERREANELDSLALDDFQAAVRHDPTKWKAIHNRGVSLALHGKIDQALADFARVLELEPQFVNSRFNRAELLVRQDKFQEAIDDYTEVLKIKGDDIGALVGRGNALLKLGKPTEAVADFDLAVRFQPTSAAAHAGRADAYTALGQWNEAGNDYREAVRLDAKLGRAYRGAAWLMATCPRDELRHADAALRSAEKAIKLDGNGDWTYLDALAAAQANAGKYDEAQATIEKALQMAPDSAVEVLQSRQDLYRDGQPYRQSTTSTAVTTGPVTR
jgi:tetratricopeptide (TPR) repeat protein